MFIYILVVPILLNNLSTDSLLNCVFHASTTIKDISKVQIMYSFRCTYIPHLCVYVVHTVTRVCIDRKKHRGVEASECVSLYMFTGWPPALHIQTPKKIQTI